ncbi:MAG: hypothetical protein ACREFJ_15010 [Acetobacteraceae bacterium]
MTVYAWILIPALIIGFFCGTAACYRMRRDRTPLAWAVLAYCFFTFAALIFYTAGVNPFRQPHVVTLTWFGVSLLMLVMGIGLVTMVPSALDQRLSLNEVRTLLPESILELSPIEMRALLPLRFQSHATHEIQVFVMMALSKMSPERIRRLTPETLRRELRRDIPYSILDAK